MAKKIKFESFKYRFLCAAERRLCEPRAVGEPSWSEFLQDLEFEYLRGAVKVSWTRPQPGSLSWPLDEPAFHRRGDSERDPSEKTSGDARPVGDLVKLRNEQYFLDAVDRVAGAAGFFRAERHARNDARLEQERRFHDAWADSADVAAIDLQAANEACTAPEMRYIRSRLGELRGKRLLDVGCGLGEASVYFATLGAQVTALDLSPGMLDATGALAARNGVQIEPHLAAAEDLRLPADRRFDIIYAGNLLHHVDVERTLLRLRQHLEPDGTLVTWDPLAYNPLINVYRAIATDVRTPDEHPLTWRDIRLFRTYFGQVETRYFWLTTLVVFLAMFLVQRRSPNRERFWKVVVQEGEKWRRLYTPLERLDRVLLAVLPPLRLMCWNVVVFARK